MVPLPCPHCRTQARVRRDRLADSLRCPACARWFRLLASGQLAATEAPPPTVEVGVRWGLGNFAEHRVTLDDRGRPAVRQLVAHLAIATLLATGLIGAASLLRTRADAGPELLPTGLEARAEVFGRAWLSDDLPTLVALTDPARDRALRRWIADHPAPVVNADAAPIAVELAKQTASDAEITLHVGAVELPLAWTQRDDSWTFAPGQSRPSARKASTPAGRIGPTRKPGTSTTPANARRKALPS